MKELLKAIAGFITSVIPYIFMLVAVACLVKGYFLTEKGSVEYYYYLAESSFCMILSLVSALLADLKDVKKSFKNLKD